MRLVLLIYLYKKKLTLRYIYYFKDVLIDLKCYNYLVNNYTIFFINYVKLELGFKKEENRHGFGKKVQHENIIAEVLAYQLFANKKKLNLKILTIL